MTGKGYRILIVEDEYLLAENLRMLLDEIGFEVVGPAFSFAEAMELAAQERGIDAAIVDLDLKGILSLPVIDALHDRAIPVLLVSGHDMATVPPDYQHVPACQKPLRAMDVTDRLLKLIEGG